MEKIIQRELQGNATDRKRNESIVFKGFLLVGSVIDSITAKKSCGKFYIAKERQTHCKLIPIVLVLLNVANASATPSIDLVPPNNYTVFHNDNPAIFYCYGNGFGIGAVVSWSLNGTGYGTEHAQMGITYVIDPPTGDTVSSHLIIPSNSAINNNTQVVCRAADVTFSNVLTSLPANLTIQGLLQAPSYFSVYISNTFNPLFLLSWGAPFSLDVTDSPDIFIYVLCTNITIYGCRTIPSDPDCTFPRTCTSSVNFTHLSLNGTNGGQNKTIMDYGNPIHFTFCAVNGAGNGSKAKFTYLLKKESGDTLAPSQTQLRSTNTLPTISTLPSNPKSEVPIVFYGSVCGASFLLISTFVGVVCVIVCIKHKHKDHLKNIQMEDNNAYQMVNKATVQIEIKEMEKCCAYGVVL